MGFCGATARCVSAAQRTATSLHFEFHRIEGSLQQVNVASVASDDQLAIAPLGIFVSADEERQGELFEHVVVRNLEFVAEGDTGTVCYVTYVP